MNETPLGEFQVIMQFGSGYSSEAQSRLMLALEKLLRGQGIPAEVLKETKPDDSKLRRNMTPLQRSLL